MNIQPIYLDNASTTPLKPKVLERMLEFLKEDGIFANPSAKRHFLGSLAHDSLQEITKEAKTALGLFEQKLFWTSGATESNTWVLLGLKDLLQSPWGSTKGEHSSVALALKHSKKELLFSSAQKEFGGKITADSFEELFKGKKPSLISMVHANGETGVINDVDSVLSWAKDIGALVHIDATQTIGKLPIPLEADYLTLGAHKCGGPKGVGALVVHPKAPMPKALVLGHQQNEHRGGTYPLHQIAGMARALFLANEEQNSFVSITKKNRDLFVEQLKNAKGFYLNGEEAKRLCTHANIGFHGVLSSDILGLCPKLCVLGTSACQSSSSERSDYLFSLYKDALRASNSLRFTLGWNTKKEEILQASLMIQEALSILQN